MSFAPAAAPPALRAPSLTATLLGSPTDPSLLLSFPPNATHARSGQLMMTWVKQLPGARFDPGSAGWIVTGIGETPQSTMNSAGFWVHGLGQGTFEAVQTLDQLVWPASRLDDDGRTVLVRHRLGGFEACRERIGPAATWDKRRRLFKMPLSDLLVAGVPRAGVIWDPAAIDAAFALNATSPLVPGLEASATRLAAAADRSGLEADVAAVASTMGHYPTWWQIPPLPHQVPGALATAAARTPAVGARPPCRSWPRSGLEARRRTRTEPPGRWTVASRDRRDRSGHRGRSGQCAPPATSAVRRASSMRRTVSASAVGDPGSAW